MKPWFLAWLLCCAAERTHYGFAEHRESPELSIGTLVRLEGLQSNSGKLLNGFKGRIRSWDADRGRFLVQLRGFDALKALKVGNLKPLVQLPRSVLAHQMIDLAPSDFCADVPAAVLANRAAAVMWFLGVTHQGPERCSDITHCDFLPSGITWTEDCQVQSISLPRDQRLVGTFSSVNEFLIAGEGNESSSVFGTLHALRKIDLAETQIAGDLTILELTPQLKVLNLSMTSTRGRVQFFRSTPELEVLDLSFTKAVGDLEVFEATPHLRSLRLARTDVGGHLSSLQTAAKLEILDLSRSNVRGSLEDGFPKLQELTLRGSAISGNLGIFLHNLRQLGTPLRHLDLSSTQFEGSTIRLARWCPMERIAIDHAGDIAMHLRHFRNCTQLTSLTAAHSAVKGSFASLDIISQLQELDLSFTEVVGTMEAFRDMTNLQSLQLSGTNVDGDVSVFSTTPNLRKLKLCETKVAGRFEARPPRPKLGFQLQYLQEVDFTKTKVQGDLKDLPVMPQLQRLALKSSYVSGELKVLLLKAEALQVLELADARIAGDIAELSALPRLREVDVTGTKVAGDISSLGAKLQKAIFSWSNVTGDIQVFSAFQELQKISLDHTKVYGDIKAFRHIKVLTDLDLSSTEVAGNIEAFENSFESLQKLDLSFTGITGDIGVIGEQDTVGQVEEISLDHTAVWGDIKVFQRLWRLRKVSLSHTEVAGDVKAFGADMSGGGSFPHINMVEELSLSFTKVYGNTDHLSTAAKLKRLDLKSTEVTGDFMHLMACTKLQKMDLSNTSVNGSFKFMLEAWAELRLDHLEVLSLANTQITLEEDFASQQQWISDLSAMWDFTLKDMQTHRGQVFPALKWLDVSGCPLNGNLTELLKVAGLSRHLHTIEASGCNLTGHLPNLKEWKSPLWESLGKLVLQSNNITWVEAIPRNLFILDLSNNPRVGFKTEVFKKALEDGVYLHLQNSTLLDDDMARILWEGADLKRSPYIGMSEQSLGYECHPLLNENPIVSPDKFLPNFLCQCLPGWQGKGTSCVKCAANFFNAESNSTCKKCPKDSKSPEASTSPDACQCPRGQEIFENQNGTLQCGCRPSFALGGLSDPTECVECEELKLQCPEPGMSALEAEPRAGYVRLETNSSKVYLCLSETRCQRPNCTEGFDGPLCIDCAKGFRSVKGGCQACSKDPPKLFIWLSVSLLLLGSAAGAAAYIWSRRPPAPTPTPTTTATSLKWKVLQKLVEAQAPVLLQLCQLWAALAVLAFVGKGSEEMSQHKEEDGNSWSATLWELPYVQTLQLSLNAFKDSMALQCSYHDGAFVRFCSALAAPLLPLLVLAACALLELLYPSKGVSAALKVLTLLFIGGASSCGNLLTCQYVDGADEPLGRHAFRLHMPLLQCHEQSWQAFWADVVAYTTSFGYGILIPVLLLHLFTRQHLLMTTCRSVAAVTQVTGHDDRSLCVCLQSLTADGKLLFQDRSGQVAGHLVAAAAARIAVSQQQHRLKLRMVGDAIYLEDQGSSNVPSASFDDENVTSWIASEEEMKSGRAVRCRLISEMLMERCTLEAAHNERTLTGAKEIFYKYSSCRYVWMEVFLKLVSLALVTADSMALSVAVCLVTAATMVLARPYAQPQVNSLHSFCFFCLAVSSVAFFYHLPGLSRWSLLLPFILAALQLLRPDSAEALSVRLFNQLLVQLESLSAGKEVELEAELCHFI